MARRFTVVVLFIVTLSVAVSAIYIGVKLSRQPDLTPDDSSAASDLPVCFIDTFSGTGQLNTSDWRTNIQGFESSIIQQGGAALFVLSDTPQIDREVRAYTVTNFERDMDIEVQVTEFQKNNSATLAEGRAFISYLYDPSNNSNDRYKLEVYKANENQLIIRGVIDSLEDTVVLTQEQSQFPISLVISVRAEGRDTDTVALKYSLDNETYITLLSTTTVTNRQTGAPGIGLSNTDVDEISGSFDNFTVYCASDATITPSPTEIVEPTLPPGTCQCDLSVVITHNCQLPQVPRCTSQVSCACLAPTGTPTPTVSIGVSTTVTPTLTRTPSPSPTRTPVPTSPGQSTNVPTVLPTNTTGQTPVPTSVLPATAIISEDVDRIILAIALIIGGSLIYGYAKSGRKFTDR